DTLFHPSASRPPMRRGRRSTARIAAYGSRRDSQRRSSRMPRSSSVNPDGANPCIAHSAPRKGNGKISRAGSPDVATSTTDSTNGIPKQSAMATPATTRWRAPSAAGYVSCMARVSITSSARMDLERIEEERDLEGRRLRRVRAVDGIRLDRGGKLLADRPGRGLRGVGGAHQLAQPCDRAFTLEHHRYTRPLGHERAQARVERPLLVHDVEAARPRG